MVDRIRTITIGQRRFFPLPSLARAFGVSLTTAKRAVQRARAHMSDDSLRILQPSREIALDTEAVLIFASALPSPEAIAVHRAAVRSAIIHEHLTAFLATTLHDVRRRKREPGGVLLSWITR